MEFTPYFKRYEAIAAEADKVFSRVSELTGPAVSCKPGCSECCHAPFDLSFIEALYINQKFRERFPQSMQRAPIEDRADRADRDFHVIKKKAFKASENGVPHEQILADLAKERIRCPLLDEEDHCILYEHRPITCRLYGVPLDIRGEAKACGKSGFTQGGKYPAVKVELLQDRLMELSAEFVAELGSKYTDMATMLIPVSMALLTDFDDEYLGLNDAAREFVDQQLEKMGHGRKITYEREIPMREDD